MQSNANNWSFNKIIAVSVATGVVVLLFLLVLLAFAFWGALFWGAIVGGIVFLILWLNFGSDQEEASGTGTGSGTGSGAGSAVATPSAGAATGSDTTVGHSGAATASAAGVGVASTSAADVAVDSGAETESSEAAADVTETGSAMKPSKELPGQAELAARKGEWKYSDAGAGDSGAATDAPATDAAADDGLGEDYDKDGVREGTDEGAKPVMLTEARDGGADNLKEIKGVGPKMEQMLNGMGVYHFDQIAAWTANEVAWVDANLKGFKGRVSRDGWVDQAKILMTGAETEFSQRVEDGKVY